MLIVARAKGAYFYDHKGRRYLDGVSSLWVNLHGHNHPALNAAIRRQLSRVAHSTFLGLSHEPAIRLGRDLAAIAPAGLGRIFYSDNGATAVEVALKMAFQYWIETGAATGPRDEFLAADGSYHGDTIGSVSVGSVGAFHGKFKRLLFKSHFSMAPFCASCPKNRKKARHRFRTGERLTSVPRPGDKNEETGCRWECLADVARILRVRRGRIAAGILEPVVQGASGIRVLPPGYTAGFARLCRKNDVLFIADEVATGFGRTGTTFACEQEDVRPDLLCVAKAVTGGYAPLAATLATDRIFRAFWGPPSEGRTFFHGHSYTGYPLGAAVAVANLKLIRGRKFLEKSRRMAHLMKERLERLSHLPVVGSVRQAGLMAGVELMAEPRLGRRFPPDARMGARVCKRLLGDGIWLRPLGDTIVVMPPVVTPLPALRGLFHALERAILHETKT